MRTHRSLLVFIGVSLILAIVAWSLLATFEDTSTEQSRPVHFKVRPGVQAATVMKISGELSPLFVRSVSELAADRKEAMALGAIDSPDLSLWYRVDVAGDPDRLVRELLRNADVVSAFVAPVAEPALLRAEEAETSVAAGDRCPIETPSYDELQGYLAPAPGGIDVAAAWEQPGGRGRHVGFADIEGAWNAKHEDIPTERMFHVAGRNMRDRAWVAHGTAVVGVVASRDNDLGMIGIAPDVAKIVTASIDPIGAAAAIDRAQAELQAGDILLIELHSIGPRRRYLPMEFWDDVFDAVKATTDRGVVVVAAAGNGAENLDHRSYHGKFDRNLRDSGAILVGAGAPSHRGFVDRSRLDFSNYGSRVDVQGWGYKVASLDYGDLQDCGAPHVRKYTAEFAGTSSASPVVVGAGLLLQSIYKERTGSVMSPLQLRDLLRRTGSAQVDGPEGPAARQHIGPRPDLRRAIAELP